MRADEFCAAPMQATIMSVLALFAICFGIPSDALSQATIPERVRQHGDLNVPSHSTIPLMSLEDVITSSDLILRTKVTSAVPRLSLDQRYVTTEFGLEPIAVLLHRRESRPTPGALPRLAVSVVGGQMVVEGHNVSWTDSSLRTFEVGKEYVLFLQESPQLGTYILTGSANGAFEIVGDVVKPRREAHGAANEAVGLFIKHVQELIARRH